MSDSESLANRSTSTSNDVLICDACRASSIRTKEASRIFNNCLHFAASFSSFHLSSYQIASKIKVSGFDKDLNTRIRYSRL